MMQVVPEEESRRWKAEVAQLRASPSAEDQVMAILMDLEIGGSGNGGDSARKKAKAICELLSGQFEEAREIIAQVSYSPEFRKFHYLGQEQDPCGVHAFTAKYKQKSCGAQIEGGACAFLLPCPDHRSNVTNKRKCECDPAFTKDRGVTCSSCGRLI